MVVGGWAGVKRGICSTVRSLLFTSVAANGVVLDHNARLLYDSAAPFAPVRSALSNLHRYRALVRLLVARESTVSYKRSLLEVTWTIRNPLLATLVMWLAFQRLFGFQISGNVPYLVYLLSGILAVAYFKQRVAMTAGSMATSARMLTKVYAPFPP
jgi:ABC-type polysaccharide/polyol phosphate export permease